MTYQNFCRTLTRLLNYTIQFFKLSYLYIDVIGVLLGQCSSITLVIQILSISITKSHTLLTKGDEQPFLFNVIKI